MIFELPWIMNGEFQSLTFQVESKRLCNTNLWKSFRILYQIHKLYQGLIINYVKEDLPTPSLPIQKCQFHFLRLILHLEQKSVFRIGHFLLVKDTRTSWRNGVCFCFGNFLPPIARDLLTSLVSGDGWGESQAPQSDSGRMKTEKFASPARIVPLH